MKPLSYDHDLTPEYGELTRLVDEITRIRGFLAEARENLRAIPFDEDASVAMQKADTSAGTAVQLMRALGPDNDEAEELLARLHATAAPPPPLAHGDAKAHALSFAARRRVGSDLARIQDLLTQYLDAYREDLAKRDEQLDADLLNEPRGSFVSRRQVLEDLDRNAGADPDRTWKATGRDIKPTPPTVEAARNESLGLVHGESVPLGDCECVAVVDDARHDASPSAGAPVGAGCGDSQCTEEMKEGKGAADIIVAPGTDLSGSVLEPRLHWKVLRGDAL